MYTVSICHLFSWKRIKDGVIFIYSIRMLHCLKRFGAAYPVWQRSFNLLKVNIVTLWLFLKDKHVSNWSPDSRQISVWPSYLVSVYLCFPQSAVSLVKFLFCFAWKSEAGWCALSDRQRKPSKWERDSRRRNLQRMHEKPCQLCCSRAGNV